MNFSRPKAVQAALRQIKQLAFLEANQPVNGAEIITLAFHVDYWNRLGWKDEFSSPTFSERQNQYVQRMGLSSSYTPQMVVDGQAEFVGSDAARAAEAITEAANGTKSKTEINISGATASINLSDIATRNAATVYLAIAEDDLTTDVKAGENGGRKLSHISVVRKFDAVGQIGSDQKQFSVSVPFSLQPEWKRPSLKIIVFAQENKSGRVIAIGSTKL